MIQRVSYSTSTRVFGTCPIVISYCRRKLHTELVKCGSDVEYLAKVYCLRQAYTKLFNTSATATFIADMGRQIISDLIIYADKVISIIMDKRNCRCHVTDGRDTRSRADENIS